MTEDADLPGRLFVSSSGELDEFRALVQAAFEQALNSGKPDWDQMTSAVLKNRLLSITDRQFSEDRYKSPSFIHLVRRIPDLVEVIDNNPPFRLKLKHPLSEVAGAVPGLPPPGEGATEVATGTPEGSWRNVRIRPDLWRAVIDYQSGNQYVLDQESGQARPRIDSDAAIPVIPTASQDDVQSWREQFVESLTDSQRARFSGQLSVWTNSDGRQTDLPHPMRGRWAEFMKKKVSEILNGWYDQIGLVPPSDMLSSVSRSNVEVPGPIEEVAQARQLRNFIINAVRAMTYEELCEISLPARVVVRVSGSSSSQ